MQDGRINYKFSTYSYSGRIVAEAFAHMQGMDVERVVVLGPCHRYYSSYSSNRIFICSKCMLTTASEIETPLGNLAVDREAQAALNQKVK